MSESKARRIPAEPGIWVFVIGDMVVFGIIFANYVYYRALSPDVYAEAHTLLSVPLGLVNTFILLTGSLFVARGVEVFRHGEIEASRRLIGWGIGCGLAFCAIKCIEWGEKIVAGITPMTNEFFMFYFMMTGIHLVHVILATILLVVVRNWKPDPAKPEGALLVTEAGGIIWHLIDLIWILLFPLLYLTV